MILEHLGHRPRAHATAVVAPTATVCGDVRIGAGSRILHGACVIVEGGRIELGENVIVLQNAVIRSTTRWSTTIGSSTLIGPNAHVVGSSVAECVSIATGASVFHGSRLDARSEVRINGVVHVRSVLPADATVPIGWVAVGDPASILPPNEHDAI
jgi:carbonic anhydrase/acetyltransferase-like protein (isoleucine patch superfamily)